MTMLLRVSRISRDPSHNPQFSQVVRLPPSLLAGHDISPASLVVSPFRDTRKERHPVELAKIASSGESHDAITNGFSHAVDFHWWLYPVQWELIRAISAMMFSGTNAGSP
jgi:hypothetical protein